MRSRWHAAPGSRRRHDDFAGGDADARADRGYAGHFDPQPQHLDEAAAVSTGFGELVASGWQTVSLSLRLAEEVCPALAGGRYRIDSVKWQRPVRPGDTLLVEVEVLQAAPFRFQIATRHAEGETVQTMIGTTQT